MDKAEVAAILDEIAKMLELQGENFFRAQAYAKAGHAIAQLETSLADVIAAGELSAIPGIGSGLCEKITTLVSTGQLAFYDDLKKKTPAGLFQMLRLPGLGPKKIKALYDTLGIQSLEALKQACEAGEIAKLKGFGAKTQQNILDGIAYVDQAGQRVRIDQAQLVADVLASELRELPHIKQLEVCGSLRRRKETVADIDLLATADDQHAVMEAFVRLPQVTKVIGQGETKSSVVVQVISAGGTRIHMNVDLRVVSDEQFPFALNYFTGSKEHNIIMRQRAIERGLKLNEYALAGAERSVSCQDEAALYQALDLDYIEPVLRENTGEIDAAARHVLPQLIQSRDIRGVFHCHTTWSDGSATLAEMAAAAQALGYQYLGIADHSKVMAFANGLTPERVQAQQAEIDQLNAGFKDFRLFKGTEVDILQDGTLDYDDAVLETFDYVVASVHSFFHQTQEEMTARIVRALSHPCVTMLGHATGRILMRRDGYKLDIEAVLQTAAKHGKLIEINADPHRLDLDWVHCKRAKALGVKLVINPDAHSTAGLTIVPYGVDVARRAWLEKGDVFNTQTLAQVTKALRERRAR